MKVMTILGTRPEIIRLSRVIPELDRHCDHVLVHTGQNYDPALSQVFFDELDLRPPDQALGVGSGRLGEQLGKILDGTERALVAHQPDRLLVLGDTDSGLAALVAKRLGIPVYHMEAGNRCFDDRVPEEVNRRVIDHCSDVLMPYTERSRQNLLREGIEGRRIFVTGNPIFEVLDYYRDKIDASPVLERLGLEAGHYFLVTMHRAENVDDVVRLEQLARTLDALHSAYSCPVIVSVHPRTRKRMEEFDIRTRLDDVRFLEPFGLFDFVRLEEGARCVLSDSGTVQEECAILAVPCVTLRDVTERPETLERGTNILAGVEHQRVLQCVSQVLGFEGVPPPPPEYTRPAVSRTVVNLVAGFA